MRSISYWAARAGNGFSKVAAGLTPFGESVWPGVQNDLFVAHRSIYEFFGRCSIGLRVLDLGCGSGYGPSVLVEEGARCVTAVDIDARTIAYSRKHYEDTRIQFVHADLETFESQCVFDLIVSSNAFEHLEDPGSVLDRSFRWLEPTGEIMLALPPIFSEHDLSAHSGIHYHRSNLSIDGWIQLFDQQGWQMKIRAHRLASPHRAPDFSSPFPSRLTTRDFVFVESSRDDLYESGAITALFHLRRVG